MSLLPCFADWLHNIGAEDAWMSTAVSPIDAVRVHDVRFDTSHGKRDCAPFYMVLHKNDDVAQRELHAWLAEHPGDPCLGKLHPAGDRVHGTMVQ